MKNKNIIFIISLLLTFCFVLSACKNTISENLYNGIPSGADVNGEFAESSKYVLFWNADYNCVDLKEKTNNETLWSSVPMTEVAAGLDKSSKLCSPVSVAYLEPDTNLVKTAEGSEEITDIATEKIDNGIKVYYDFGNYNVCVPVSYELDGNKISVSINSDEITEAEYKIYQISVLPYMVSAKNNDSKDSYIFVPYGSGAIMYTDNTLRAPRSFNAEMYGDDLTINKEEQFNTDEALKLPVFAAQNVDNAMFAIIESGAEYASLSARAGDIDTGYSNVYPLFKLRGYNTTLIDDVSSEGKYIMRISDERVSDVYKVSYYFMDNAEASISSMAELYRNYINSVYGERNVASQKPYYLKILGGSFVDDYFLGIPKEELYCATTYSSASEIISELADLTKEEGAIELSGFGKDGIEYGKVADGFDFGKFGKESELKALISNGAYVDYELLRFSKSANGFSALWDSAKNANNSTAYLYIHNVSDKVKNEDETYYKLLKRSSLSTAFDKLKNHTAKVGIKNISLGSIGEISYSDYSEKEYVAKGKIDEEIYTYINSLCKEDVGVKVTNANDYAAVASTIITDTPLSSGNISALDESIPFYSLVFKGRAQLYSTPLNLNHNSRQEFLNAVSCGVGLQFSVCDSYNADLKETPFGYMFAQSVYEDNEEQIAALINESSELLNKVAKARIEFWERRNNGLTVTQFDNGITVYTNFSDNQISTECGNIPAMSFKFSEGR